MLDINDIDEDGVWRDSSTNIINFEKWYSNQPSGGTIENYVVSNKKWHDVAGSKQYYTMCEMMPRGNLTVLEKQSLDFFRVRKWMDKVFYR